MLERVCAFRYLFVIACAVLLLAPRSAAADSIDLELRNSQPFGGDLVFGPTRFEGTVDHMTPFCFPLYPPCEDFVGNIVNFGTVSLEITSGPLLNITILHEEEGYTKYTYGPGTIGFEATWELPDGSLATGRWVAPLPTLTFLVYGEDVPFGEADRPSTQFAVDIGIGKFDPVLAHALGVTRKSRSADLLAFLDNIRGEPLEERYPFVYDLVLDIEAKTVPEPSIAVLALLGGVGLVVKRGRSSRLGRRPSLPR